MVSCGVAEGVGDILIFDDRVRKVVVGNGNTDGNIDETGPKQGSDNYVQ